MQAAVVSVLLMAGACADSGEQIPAPLPTVAAPAHSSTSQQDAAIYSPPTSECSTYPSPAGGIYSRTDVCGYTRYTPVWLLHKSAEFYPGNYARPYDYREIFNYPWNGPRPGVSSPALELEAAARAKTRR